MEPEKLEMKELLNRISKGFMQIDDIIHEYLFDYDKVCETFTIKKGIERATQEMLEEYQLSCWIREKVLNSHKF